MERPSANKWLLIAVIGLLPLIASVLWVRKTTKVLARQTPGSVIAPGAGRWSTSSQGKRPAGVTPTMQWVDFVSQNTTLDGVPVPEGSIIRAFDPDGVVCGEYRVDHAGWYGLLPCFGDDPTTPGDEGAQPGDTIRFTINDLPATARGPDEPTWTQSGDRRTVDLAASSQPAHPTATPTGTPQTASPTATLTPSSTPLAEESTTPTPETQAQHRQEFLPVVLKMIAATTETPRPRVSATATVPPQIALHASRWCGGKLPRAAPCVH